MIKPEMYDPAKVNNGFKLLSKNKTPLKPLKFEQ
jgi:hypothetical protein